MNIILYKAKITKSYYIAFALNIIGLLFMLNNKEFSFDIFGIIFAILSAISYAFYILASKKMEVSPLLSTLMVSIGCTITCFISALIHSSLKIPNELYVWMNLFGIAIICTAIPTLFLLKALKYISSERVSLLSVFQTLFVFILGVMLLGEQVNNLQIIGIVILLSGTLLISFFERTSH
jgi:drug/metabolite transporter (DMT)-like permease